MGGQGYGIPVFRYSLIAPGSRDFLFFLFLSGSPVYELLAGTGIRYFDQYFPVIRYPIGV